MCKQLPSIDPGYEQGVLAPIAVHASPSSMHVGIRFIFRDPVMFYKDFRVFCADVGISLPLIERRRDPGAAIRAVLNLKGSDQRRMSRQLIRLAFEYIIRTQMALNSSIQFYCLPSLFGDNWRGKVPEWPKPRGRSARDTLASRLWCCTCTTVFLLSNRASSIFYSSKNFSRVILRPHFKPELIMRL